MNNSEQSKRTIGEEVAADLKARENIGIARYGSPIRAGDNYAYSWRFMFYEELLDAIAYYAAKLAVECPEELAEWRKQQAMMAGNVTLETK